MEPAARGRSPGLARVTQKKLGGNTVVNIPYRPRKDAAYLRKTAAVGLEPAQKLKTARTAATPTPTPSCISSSPTPSSTRDYTSSPHPSASVDALSLSGTTPPSSPTMASFSRGLKTATPDSLKPSRPHLILTDTLGKSTPKDSDDEGKPRDQSFRRHHRNIGSIDSILSSTTYVNTHSECSRSESRFSQDIATETEDSDNETPPASQYHPSDHVGNVTHTPRASHSSGSSMSWNSEGQGQSVTEEEERLIDEISSWVLRNTFGKDIDDCASPYLVWDCTYRYIQELEAAANEGHLGFVQATSGQESPSSYGGGGTPGSSNNDNHYGEFCGKGKRKADGGSDDGNGPADRDNQRDEDRDKSSTPPPWSSKMNITNYSCPYRKRNPLRFNVRDYYVCATHSFADMSQLKKHIRAHHPPVQRNAGPFGCPRCLQGFASKADFDAHLRRPDPCVLSSDRNLSDPEDGITQKIISSLEARSMKNKIDNWRSLWKLLFPCDADDSIPDPYFVPVMEIFDLIDESKKFLHQLRDLLELQYRHVLSGANQALGIDLKIRQGLEKSVNTIYRWIETVVDTWEKNKVGTASPFTKTLIERATSSESSIGSTPKLLPPSPAPTPTVAAQAGSSNPAANTTTASGESPSTSGSAGFEGASLPARRRPNPPPKRIKRAELLPKLPPTQIPIPIQRARTPQAQRTTATPIRPARPVLPSQAMPAQTTTAASLNPVPAFQQTWEPPAVTMANTYPIATVSYSAPSETLQHPSLAPTHYSPMDVQQHQHQLEVQPFMSSEQQGDVMHADSMQRDLDGFRSSTSTLHASQLISTTPRSSLTSLQWMRDNRDSSQTLVEAHPPGRCRNLFCPSCNKTLPDDLTMQSPTGLHPVTTGAPNHHSFHTSGGLGPPFTTAPGTGDIPSFAEPVTAWGFDATAGTLHGGGGNGNLFGGGHHGPQEGY